MKEDHRLPFVEFRAVFQGGVLAETPVNNGATALLVKMLLQGTATRDAEQIATEIESVGGHIGSYGGNNSFGVQAEVMSGDFQLGLDLLADVVLRPSFPPAALERERQIQLAGIRAQRDDLLTSAVLLLRRGLFGDTGYGLDTDGTEASVPRLQLADLRDIHRRLAVPENCVLAIYGDVRPEAVQAAVERAFGAWPRGAETRESPPSPPPLREIKRLADTRDKKQAVLVIGFPGTTLDHPDRYALELLQEACSDLGSRVYLRIREKLGLAYYVGATNFAGLAPGYFAFYVGTEPEKVALVESELFKEAESLRAEGLTEEELKRAKAKVLGQKKIARQDLGHYAYTTSLDELYGLGYRHTETDDAHYEAVTREQTRAAAEKYLRPDALVIARVAP